jgi:class 3 adenylate cyclase
MSSQPSKSIGGGLETRYYLAFLCVPLIDLGFALILQIPLRDYVPGAVTFLALAVTVGWWLFRPVAGFLRNPESTVFPERQVANLTRDTTVAMAVLIGLQTLANFFVLPWFLGFDPRESFSTVELVLLPLIRWSFFVAVLHFVVADYARLLRLRIFEACGNAAQPRPGRLTYRLLLAFLLTSVIPVTLILLDTLSSDSGIRSELLQVVLAAVFAILVTVIFITRSFLAPLQTLEIAMQRVRSGDLKTRAPVLANDETGRLAADFNRMVEELDERRFIRETFGKYVPERVAEAILQSGGRLEPAVTTATILFCDLEKFTTLTEWLPPTEVVRTLNEYFSAVLEPIEHFGGVVNQFQGDAMLVTFNVPVPDELHADDAVSAALGILGAVEERLFAGHKLAIRIGVATGEVVAGNVGADQRFNYTVHGTAVNLAARLEQMNKDFGSRILISQETACRLTRQYPLEAVGEVQVRGMRQPVKVYRISAVQPKQS